MPVPGANVGVKTGVRVAGDEKFELHPRGARHTVVEARTAQCTKRTATEGNFTVSSIVGADEIANLNYLPR